MGNKSLRRLLVIGATAITLHLAVGQRPAGDKSLIASGTLNLILANQNGFVVAADSRMSAPGPFRCTDGTQAKQGPETGFFYCDDSQKLFRTGTRSAMVISGFAVGRKGTPLDLTVASALRRRFGPNGIADNRGSIAMVADWGSSWALEQALVGVAALYDPSHLHEGNMAFGAIYAGLNNEGHPILRRQLFRGTWRPSTLPNNPVPEYKISDTHEVPVNGFIPVAAGIDCVANAIFAGIYKTADPVIATYYSKRRAGALDQLTIAEMKSIAKAILSETRRFTDLVGGADQIAEFPVHGEAQFSLPTLPSDQQLLPRSYLKESFLYTKEGAKPLPSSQISIFEDFQRPTDESIAQYFLACQFKGVSVALDNNYFVRSSFDDVTFKWRGGPILVQRNIYSHCVIELPDGMELPHDSELHACSVSKKKQVTFEDQTVGAPLAWKTSGCVTKNADGTIAITAGGACGGIGSIQGPPIKP